ncbi:MAG: capsid cement protein [Elusimicrobiota bacterium]
MATWTLVIETEPPIPMICEDGTGIEKGTLLKLEDAYKVSASTGDEDTIAGVAAEEKIADDGKTKIAVYREGIFKAVAGGNCTAGKALASYSGSGDENDVIDGTSTTLHSKALGIALETATDGETLLVELCPGKATINALS